MHSTQTESETLTQVRDDLLSLRTEDSDARPTPYAFGKAWEVISAVGNQMGHEFPLGSAVEDGEGGIRIEWENKDRHVRLVIPDTQEKRHYIFHQEDDEHGLDNISAHVLAGWLYWLTSVTSDTSTNSTSK